MRWMIYGANGYAGELIAREAKARGMEPILAGRSAPPIAALAAALTLEHRTFSIADPAQMAEHLADVGLVLNCAGPFSMTGIPMLEACLASRIHYLDIAGEIDVLEHAYMQDARAREAGVVICGGVGFDVVPTDCVAAALKAALPDATELALGFQTPLRLSPGTLKTVFEGMPQGGRVRRDGEIVQVPTAHRARRIDFGGGDTWAMSIPWGDVSTAYHTTGIPNIEVYFATSRVVIAAVRSSHYLRPVLASRPVQSLLKGLAGRVKGPAGAARARQSTRVWGEFGNVRGDRMTARIRIANLYTVTATGSLTVTAHVLEQRTAAGAYTPATLLGPELITQLPGSGPLTVE